MVGAAGFEPAISCPPDRRSCQAEPRPAACVKVKERGEPRGTGVREPPAGVEPALSRLEDGRLSVRRRGREVESSGEPAGNRTRCRGFADRAPSQRSGSWCGEGESNPHRERGMLVPYHWAITAEVEEKPTDLCGRRESNPRLWGGSPAPNLWATPARRGGKPGTRTQIDRFYRAARTPVPFPGTRVERIAGVEPASTGWDPAILTVGRYPRLRALPRRSMRELLARIALAVSCVPDRGPAIWA
jgi:hypothetical protein